LGPTTPAAPDLPFTDQSSFAITTLGRDPARRSCVCAKCGPWSAHSAFNRQHVCSAKPLFACPSITKRTV
jgi:hypothetical protein